MLETQYLVVSAPGIGRRYVVIPREHRAKLTRLMDSRAPTAEIQAALDNALAGAELLISPPQEMASGLPPSAHP